MAGVGFSAAERSGRRRAMPRPRRSRTSPSAEARPRRARERRVERNFMVADDGVWLARRQVVAEGEPCDREMSGGGYKYLRILKIAYSTSSYI